MKKIINKAKKELHKWKNFMIACVVLAIFFGLTYFHDWANEFFIKLHFCNHTFCIIFALIFAVMAFMAWDKKKSYLKLAIIILIIGIILMNLTTCDIDGNMSLGNFSFGAFSIFPPSENGVECKPGVDCPGDIVEVPIPPCIETDDGRDYITPGTILSGANLEDMCMGTDILRERYCDSELTYTSEDVSCSDLYGEDWFCEDRECIFSETPIIPVEDGVVGNETDCGDGIDNDGDGLIDCADPDCDYPFEDGGCGIFEYSCGHNPTTPYPFCGGTCPVGSVCGIYNSGDGTLDGGWCECIPEGETSCYDSGDCTGWCDDGWDYLCTGDSFGCYCQFVFNFDTCVDTDDGIEPLVGGRVVYTPLSFPDYCVFKTNRLVESYCNIDGYPAEQEFDCEDMGLCCIEDISYGSYCGECPPPEF